MRTSPLALALALVLGASPGCGGDDAPGPQAPAEICRSASELDLWDADGQFDAAGYRALAGQLATEAGIDYRFGQRYAHYHPTPEEFPTHYLPPDRVLHQDMGNVDLAYQVGGEQTPDPGGYNSAEGQLLYVPDDPADAGLDSLSVLEVAYAVIITKPTLPWVLGGGGHPDPVVTSEEALALGHGPLRQPVALARSRGNDIWSMDAVVAFAGGQIGTTGTFGSGGNSHVFVELPAGKVPTSIDVTTSSEFALLTIWDTEALRGQLAVVAMAGPKTPGFWGDWTRVYPGLFNEGQISFMKVLGYVDLPDMVAPIAVSAVTDVQFNMFNTDDTVEYDLQDEATRQRFIDGDLAGRVPRAGFAMVLSRSEKRVTLVDLQPLLAYFADQYFGSADAFAETIAYGDAPTAWPYTFEVAPEARPQVVRTLVFDECPTAVRASLDLRKPGEPTPPVNLGRALVATEDGTLHAFDVAGLADERAADAEAIVATGTTAVGRNPTDIAYLLRDKRSFAVVSRGDRRVDFLDGDGSGTFTVSKTLRDSRLLDPVAASDVLWFGNEVPILTVADFAGKQVVNYRYGAAVLHFYDGQTYGMGESGDDDFECGGVLPTAGGAFAISSTNVP
ncbi:MAG: hypothetical protein R2939_03875 [Kofleriaceae bacterium]